MCMSEIIFSFRRLRAGSQVFALLMLFICVILHTMWLLYGFRDIWKEWGDSNFQNCQFHHRRLELFDEHFNVFSLFIILSTTVSFFYLKDAILFLQCLLFKTMWSGKSLQLLCILPFGILCLSDIRMMLVKILLAVCILVGIVV